MELPAEPVIQTLAAQLGQQFGNLSVETAKLTVQNELLKSEVLRLEKELAEAREGAWAARPSDTADKDEPKAAFL
jgi:septal ring factor EnvC (AmiA/AmiB activator)